MHIRSYRATSIYVTDQTKLLRTRNSLCYIDGMNLKKIVAALVKQHGNLRKASAETGISPAQLCRLRKGGQKNPSMDTLKKLGQL
jgi:DNA-binding Xre family transcriptional regulator